jgi:hypothetical protein
MSFSGLLCPIKTHTSYKIKTDTFKAYIVVVVVIVAAQVVAVMMAAVIVVVLGGCGGNH